MKEVRVKVNSCDFCGSCVAVCPQDAIALDEAQWRWLAERCTLCAYCIQVCPMNALVWNDEAPL